MCELQTIAYTDVVNILFVIDNLTIISTFIIFMVTSLWIYAHNSFDATFDPKNIIRNNGPHIENNNNINIGTFSWELWQCVKI